MSQRPVIEELLDIQKNNVNIVFYRGERINLADLKTPLPKTIKPVKKVNGSVVAQAGNEVIRQVTVDQNIQRFTFGGLNFADYNKSKPHSHVQVIVFDRPYILHQTGRLNPFTDKTDVSLMKRTGGGWKQKGAQLLHAKRFADDPHVYLQHLDEDRGIYGYMTDRPGWQKTISVGGYPLNPEQSIIADFSMYYLEDGLIRKLTKGDKVGEVATDLSKISPLGNGLIHVSNFNNSCYYEGMVVDGDLNTIHKPKYKTYFRWAQGHLIEVSYAEDDYNKTIYQGNEIVARIHSDINIVNVDPFIIVDDKGQVFRIDDKPKSIGSLENNQVAIAYGQRHLPAKYYTTYRLRSGKETTTLYDIEDLLQ